MTEKRFPKQPTEIQMGALIKLTKYVFYFFVGVIFIFYLLCFIACHCHSHQTNTLRPNNQQCVPEDMKNRGMGEEFRRYYM